ncbi:MAG: TrkA family potassium uptake protein, partial [Proteobacteria bacterium]|nr:TrkA family potassium uptake protein [Pseudomonadota bacterium]
RFCVIGLGKFGYHVAVTLFDSGHEVTAIDQDAEKVNRIKDNVTNAVIGDASSKDFLMVQSVETMDAVIVSVGEQSHLATLITLFLREVPVPRIVVKTTNINHGRILERIGATDIIFPEKDIAVKVAQALSHPEFVEFLPLPEDYILTETAPPKNFHGKSLIELDLRKRFQITVIGLKNTITGEFTPVPQPSRIIQESDHLVFFGKSDDIEKALEENV